MELLRKIHIILSSFISESFKLFRPLIQEDAKPTYVH